MANPSSMLRETTTDQIAAEVARTGLPDRGHDAAAATQHGVDFDGRLGDVGNWRARAANLASVEHPALRAAEHARILTQGYCYPGRGGGPEMPGRREGAALWFEQLHERLPRLELTLLVGERAQQQFLRSQRKSSLAQTARAWREYAPHYIALPHPSPRNQSWFKRNPWFDRQVVPMLRERIAALSGP